jgi:hypothetical protein
VGGAWADAGERLGRMTGANGSPMPPGIR